MPKQRLILIAGGDLRQYYLAQILAKTCTVYTTGLEKCAPAFSGELPPAQVSTLPPPDYIILPVPSESEKGVLNTPFSAARISTEILLSCADEHTVVLGGRLDGSLLSMINERGLVASDYLKREELAVKNAAVTAEGAVCLAMEELPYTIDQTPVLVIGYGRIGRLLAKKLGALGAKVTVAARSLEARAWAQTEGSAACSIEELDKALPAFPLIFNTAPAEVLSEALLTRVRLDCLIVDLASKPGGIDQLCARRLGLKTIWALSLPGKTAPYTAAQIIAETVENIDAERRRAYGAD